MVVFFNRWNQVVLRNAFHILSVCFEKKKQESKNLGKKTDFFLARKQKKYPCKILCTARDERVYPINTAMHLV